MSSRVSPSERLRAEIDRVFAESGDLAGAIEKVAQLGAQLLLQTALEAEISVFLNRDRYARAALTEDARAGMRNGYAPVTVKTTAGPVSLSRPKLRGTTEAFASQLFVTGVTRTNALEALVIAGFVRGLSTRDVEATLLEALGPDATVPDLRRDQGAVRSVAVPPPRRRDVGLPVPGRVALQVSRQRRGRAGARRLGDRHRGQADLRRAGRRGRRDRQDKIGVSRPTLYAHLSA